MQSFASRTLGRLITFRLIAAAGLALAPHMVFADPAPRTAVGQKLAQQYCAECHVIAPNGKRGWTDAPAFDAVANRPGTTMPTLTTFIERPHMHMENTGRPPAEANEIAAYILSLRQR